MPLSTVKQSPFSLYDLVGYLIPGMYFSVLFFFLDYKYINHQIFDFFYMDEILKSCNNIEYFLFFFPLSVVFLYIAGHLLSIMSNIFLEGIPYFYRLKRPFKFMLYDQNVLEKEEDLTFFSQFFFYSTDDESNFLEKIYKVPINVIFGLFPLGIPLFVFVKIFASSLSKNDKETGMTEENNFHSIVRIKDENIARKKIDNLLIKYFGFKKNSTLPKDVDQYFNYLFHIVLKDSNSHFPRIHNYIALYGFMRNMLFSSILLFYFSIIIALNYKSLSVAIVWLVSFWFINVFFAYGYLKYTRRFAEEIIFAAAIIDTY